MTPSRDHPVRMMKTMKNIRKSIIPSDPGPDCPHCGNPTKTLWYFNIDCWYELSMVARINVFYCYKDGLVSEPPMHVSGTQATLY